MKSIKTSIITKLLSASLCLALIFGSRALAFADTPESSNTVTPNWMTCTSKYEVDRIGDPWTEHCDFVRYLTGSWSPASQYTWGKSQSVSLSFSGNITSGGQSQAKSQLGLK